MTTPELPLTHNGTAYTAVPGRIERTFLGFHTNHLRMVAVGISLPDSGYINTGDYVPDQNVPGEDSALGKAFSMDYVTHVLLAAGSDTWEGLKGSRVLVLFNAASIDGHGQPALGLARLDGSHVVIFQDLADSWKAREN